MNLRDLEYLVALADHRHFGRAASACFVSQPTLSTQLKKLERELGVALVERSHGGVLLTTAGEAIVERSRHLLQDAAEIRSIARQAAEPGSGTVSLGVFPTLGPYLLPHVMENVRRALPDLRLRLVEAKTADLLDQVRAGTLDAALVAIGADLGGLDVRPLFREEFVLAVPRDLDIPEPATMSTLGEHEVLLLDEGHCLRDQALAVCTTAGASESGFRATSLETLRHMVASGEGVTLLPRMAVSPPVAKPAGLAVVELAEPRPSRDIALVSRPTTPVAGLLHDLGDLVADLPPGLATPLRDQPAA